MDQSNEIRIATDEGAVYRVQVPAGLMSDIVKPVWSKYSNAQRVSSLHLPKGPRP